MIKQTQEQWLNSQYIASSFKGGLSFPNYEKIAQSFNLDYFEIDDMSNDLLEVFFANEKASLLNVKISPKARVTPQVKFGRPNEDMEPLLSRDFFLENMIVKPLDVSLDN